MLAELLFAAKLSVKPAACEPAHFVAKAYQDLLGRPVDQAGEMYWLNVLKQGTTRTQIASQWTQRAEYRNAAFRNLFNSYLHRTPNGGETSYFSAMTTEQAASIILSSAEYFTQRGGGTNPGFIAAMYQDVLGRAPDAQASLFTQQLAASASRSTVVQAIVMSAEARYHRVNALYMKFLHRAASGPMPPGNDEQIAAAIVGSDEYCRQ
jgi:Domain of unknown function (DUF4214)